MQTRGLIALSVISSFTLQLLPAEQAYADSKPAPAEAAKPASMPAPATSAPPSAPPSATDVRNAAKAFREGKRLVNKRQLPEAIAKLEEAYALDPRHEHLYNLGVAHQLNLNAEAAIEFYRRYLAADPGGKQAGDAARYLKALEDKAAKEKKQRDAEEQAARQELEAKQRVETAERERDQARAEAAAALARATAAEEMAGSKTGATRTLTVAGSRRGEGLRLAGVGLGVAGLAGLAAGGYFAARSSRLSDELSETNAVYDPDKVDEGEAADRNMTIAFIAGGVLLAGGVAVFTLGRSRGKERPTAAVTPVVQPGGGAVVLTGAW